MNVDQGDNSPDKAAVRAAASQLRGQLTNGAVDVVGAAESLSGHVRTLLSAHRRIGDKPMRVAGYWPIGSELDVRPLMRDLERDGHSLCLPVVPGPDRALIYRAWSLGDPLVDGPYGTSEPAGDAPQLIPDVMLVPLLAFDGDAFRVGYGGGFYDRTISALREAGSVLAIGTAYAAQMVDKVPHEAHDAPLDVVATERGIYVPGAATRESAGGKA